MVSSLWSLFLLASAAVSTPFASNKAAAAEYDYIVVGSGPGGGVTASNLARANYSVLLLEAGENAAEVPFGTYPPTSTWDFFVKHYEDEARQKKFNYLTWRLTDGTYWVGKDNPPSGAKLLGVYYPRGATLGGSSMINAMVTYLPPDSDWNYIANLTGDSSWSSTNMRSLFQRIEHANNYPANAPGHGYNGWFQTNLQKAGTVQNPALQVMQAEASALGKDPNQVSQMSSADPNFLSPTRDTEAGIWGLAVHQNAQGQRFSSRHYVQDTLNNKAWPLTLTMNALATRVLFSNSSTCADGKPRATGVEYLTGRSVYRADSRSTSNSQGTLATATARKEVIVSGGTFNSPQLLMLSGIGPKAHLESLKIPVVADSPGVGSNLQDNQEMPVVGQVKGGGGMGGGSGYVFIKTSHAVENERDVWFMQGNFAFRGFWPNTQSNRNLSQDPAGTYALSMVKNHPQNRAGVIRLKTADPRDPPDINFNHYKEGRETDMGAIKEAVAWVRKVYANTKAPTGPVTPKEPPCPNGPDANDSCGQADEDWIEGQTFGHHPTSTCAIGAKGVAGAVLDSRFRVQGVNGLRVIDASVFPRLPGIFPAVSTFMVGQKGSDVLIEDVKAGGECAA